MKDVSRKREDFGRKVKRVEKGAAIRSLHTGASNNLEIRAESPIELQAKQFLVSERVIQQTPGTQDELRPGDRKTNLR